MQTFEIKRGHGKTLEGDGLKNMMEDEFGSVKKEGESTFKASFKALKSIVVEFRSIKEIGVETETDNETEKMTMKMKIRRKITIKKNTMQRSRM